MTARASAMNRILRHALVSSVLTLAAFLAPVGVAYAQAEYGGLGVVSHLAAHESTEAHNAVNISSQHAFAVDEEDGSYFIGDKFEGEEEKDFIRVQKLSATGEFLAETRIQATSTTEFAGFAIDPKKHRLYLLIQEVRPPGTDELVAAKELWSFSTEASSKKELSPSLLAGAALLGWESTDEQLALIEPTGITVDPQTHDVIILGHANAPTAEEPERLVAGAQRVHFAEEKVEGKLGPRYVDTANCLGGIPTAAEEKALEKGEADPCAEGEGVFSPTVAPDGRLLVQRQGGEGEIWELPTSEDASREFGIGQQPIQIASQPKRLFTYGVENSEHLFTTGSQKILAFAGSGEEGERNTMVAVPGTHGTKVYVLAAVTPGHETKGPGVLVFNYVEGATPRIEEFGWTGGLPESEHEAHEKCALPEAEAGVPLLGADHEEQALIFDVSTLTGPKHPEGTAVVQAFGFGSPPKLELCGHSEATPPQVNFGTAKNVAEVPVGKEATVTSELVGANAASAVWKFTNEETGKEQTVTTGYQFQTPTLGHTFEEPGNYKITEEVTPDDFGPTIVEPPISKFKVAASPVTAAIQPPTSAIVAGKAATLTGNMTDKNETPVSTNYTWEFGDGSKQTGSGGAEFKVTHVYTSPGPYVVKLTVTDAHGRVASAERMVTVGEESKSSPASSGGSGSSGGSTTTSSAPKTEVLPSIEASDPDAGLASTSLSVSPNGTLAVKVTCPVGQTSCTGTVTLRTLTAVSSGAHKHKEILTLASASFSVAGGQSKSVTLHLASAARALLAHSHVLRAKSTLIAHNPSGAVHTTQLVVTLRPTKPKSHKKH